MNHPSSASIALLSLGGAHLARIASVQNSARPRSGSEETV
jgi:hypothetical protein